MICYFTDINRNHAQLLNIKPSYFRLAVAGGAQTTQTNFDNTFEKDPSYYNMVNYCSNTLRAKFSYLRSMDKQTPLFCISLIRNVFIQKQQYHRVEFNFSCISSTNCYECYFH